MNISRIIFLIGRGNGSKRGILQRSQGFTLLEIMVAVAIIAIAFTSVLKLHSQTVAMNIASNFHVKAPLLARKVMAEWETGMATDGSIQASSDSLDGFPGFTFETNQDTIVFDALYPEKQDDSERQLVEIACTILYNHGEYQYTAKTLKFISQ
mgnify:CR=1 FL=1